jgi:hypothetical protein
MIVEAVIRDRIQPLIHNMQNPTQRGFTKGSSPMNAALPVEEAYDTFLSDYHTDLKTIGRASCPFYAAFRIVVQAFNNSPRFAQDVQTTLHYSVLSSVMHISWSTWLLTLRTSRDMNCNQRKV